MTGGVTHADFALQVGHRTETVEVEGAAPLVELSPNNNNYVDQAKIESVPLNGRDFNSLFAITPGVQRTPGGGFFAVSINGSRTTSNNYFIDGMYNNDRYYGDPSSTKPVFSEYPAVTFPPDAIQELMSKETPPLNSVLKAAPRSTRHEEWNQYLHGRAQVDPTHGFGGRDQTIFQNMTVAAIQVPALQLLSTTTNSQQRSAARSLKTRPSSSCIYEGQRYKSVAVKSVTVPTTADVNAALAAVGDSATEAGLNLLSYSLSRIRGNYVARTPTTDSMNGFGVKVDHKFNTRHTLTGRYIFGDSLQSAPPIAGLPANSSKPEGFFNSIALSRTQMAGVSHTWNIGNNKILESRLGFQRFAQIIGRQ